METGILTVGTYRQRVYRLVTSRETVRVTGSDGLPYTIPSEYYNSIRWNTKSGK